jgi:copper(I)-binding protein
VKPGFALSILAALLVAACAQPAPMITVSEAKVIATPSSAAAYFTLANSGGPDRLASVEAPGVGQASLHETRFEGGIMRMRAIEGGIAVPAHERVLLSPQGRHVMIQQLARPLVPGASIKLTLHFERQDDVTISAPISGPRPSMSGMAM